MISLPKRLGKVTVLGKNCDFPEGTNSRTAFMIQRKTSCLGNPNIRGVHGNKAEVIEAFKIHLDKELEDEHSDISLQMYKFLNLIISGKDVHLKCGCKPAACHGDIIKDKLEQMLRWVVAFPDDDGITHLNIYSKGKTKLGQQLSNFAYTPITVPIYGNFNSIEGLWFYLASGTFDEKFKTLYGVEAKTYKSKLPVKEKVSNEKFKAVILEALAIKLNTYPKIKNELLSCNLPLMHYYVDATDKTKVHEPDKHCWVIDFFNDFRAQSKNINKIQSTNLCQEINIELL